MCKGIQVNQILDIPRKVPAKVHNSDVSIVRTKHEYNNT